jgi:branched-chain amino acid transport system permease protein
MKNLRSTLLIALVSVVGFAILETLIQVHVLDDYTLQILCIAGINVLVALSLNLISGFTGQLALGHAGFMAVGAYTTGILLVQAHWLLLPALLAGGLMTAFFGLLIGMPTLRLRGDYLAIVTLGFGEIIRVAINNFDEILRWVVGNPDLPGWTGGPTGLSGIPGYDVNIMANNPAAFLWIYPGVALSVILVMNLIRSSHGRALVAIREDEISAQAMGVNLFGMKLTSFVISAFLAGLGGALYAPFIGYLSPPGFDFLRSVFFVIIVVLGGMGSITGTVIAGIGLTFLQEFLRTNAKDAGNQIILFVQQTLFPSTVTSGAWTVDLVPLSQVLFGLILILLMIFRPGGLMGTRELPLTRWLTTPWWRKKGAVS